jgi:transcriptional regulator with XRE-family HTH domain
LAKSEDKGATDKDISSGRAGNQVSPITLEKREARVRFGLWMMERRNALGITQAEAAQRAGIALAQWSRLERGESGTRRGTIVKIAKGLGEEPETALAILGERARDHGPATDADVERLEEMIERLESRMDELISLTLRVLRQLGDQQGENQP